MYQANSAAVESTGQAKAEAQSRAEAAKIEGEAAVDQAKLKAQAMKIEAVSWGHWLLLMSVKAENEWMHVGYLKLLFTFHWIN